MRQETQIESSRWARFFSGNQLLQHLIALLTFSVTLFIIHPKWFNPGYLSGSGDMLSYLFVGQVFNQQSFGQGIIPLWNPFHYCGVPFHAAMQGASFYPFTWLIISLWDVVAGIQVFRIFHVILFSFLLYCWLSVRYQIHFIAAIAGGLIALNSAFIAGHQDHINQLAAVAWIPSILWSFQILLGQALDITTKKGSLNNFRLMHSLFQVGQKFFLFKRMQTGNQFNEQKSFLPLSIFLFAFLLTLQILAGHPQYVFYTLFTCLAYLIYWIFFQIRSGQKFQKILLASTVAPFSILIGFGFSALQWIPTKELSSRSYRIFDDFNYATFMSLPPKDLPGLIFPFINSAGEVPGEFGVYFGIAGIILILVFFCIPANWKVRNFIILGLITLTILLAFGKFSIVYDCFFAVFKPIVKHLRVPPRILVLNLILYAFLIGILMNFIIQKIPKGGMIICTLICLILIVEGKFYHLKPHPNYNDNKTVININLTEYFSESPFDQNDLEQHRLWRLMPNDPQFYQSEMSWISSQIFQPVHAGIWLRKNRLLPNLNALAGVQNLEGYEEGLIPTLRYGDFLSYFNRNLRNDIPEKALIDLLGVKWIYFKFLEEQEYHTKYYQSIVPKPFNISDKPFIKGRSAVVNDPKPVAQWLYQIHPALNLTLLDGPVYQTDGIAAPQIPINRNPVNWQVKDNTTPWGFDLKQLPIDPYYLNKTIAHLQNPSTSEVKINFDRVTGNRYTLSWGQPLVQEEWLWFSMSNYPGFQAKAYQAGNADQTKIYPVNAIGYLIYCPKETEKVEVFYNPDSFRSGLFISLITLVLMLVWCSFDLFQPKSSRQAPFDETMIDTLENAEEG